MLTVVNSSTVGSDQKSIVDIIDFWTEFTFEDFFQSVRTLRPRKIYGRRCKGCTAYK